MVHALALAVVLQMNNVAAAPSATVERAQKEVVRLYRGIGVDVEWNRSPAPDAEPFTIHVVLAEYEGGLLQRRPKTVLGAAIRTERGLGLAYVFYRRVEAEARQYGASEAHVLACAIAHEMAHVLLPEHDHSPLGLMRACWDREDFGRAERGQLRFSDAEAALIRARMRGVDPRLE
jgi:hypothetical protein